MRRVHSIAFAALLIAPLSVRAQMQIQPNVSDAPAVSPMLSDRFTWTDSNGQTRVAVIAHDNAGVFNNDAQAQVYGMALREFRYQINGTTRIADVTTYGNGGHGGFGYIVDHSNAGNCIGDDSPLSDYFQYGTFTPVFEGRHHAVIQFTQNYQRNCPGQTRYIPVTIQWVLSTGRDNPLYAITQDVSAIGADILNDDSRAPYGELNIDGVGAANIEGVAWGDRYKFTSTSVPLTLSSSWDYTQLNTVPYIKEWIASTNATMGLVQTQTMDHQDAGGGRNPFYHDITVLWGHTSAELGNNGYAAACPYLMPCQNEWAYQANADNLAPGVSNNNARMTWGAQFGFLGQTQYDAHDPNQRMLPGYPKKSYSVYVVLGPHTPTNAVDAQVAQVEAMESVTLTTATGSVVTSGPAGVGDSTVITYPRAGYNHVYGALAFSASNNNLDATITVGTGSLKNPLIIVSNFTGSSPTIKFGGNTLAADVDYFASTRTNPNELWITLNRTVIGAGNHFEVITASGPPSAPVGLTTIAVSSSQINVSWNPVAGASSYQVDRQSVLNGPFVQVGTPNANAFNDGGLQGSHAYIYRVRAVNGSGTSANSAIHLSTTVVYSNNPLAAGVTVLATHLAEIRSAVDVVRAFAGSGSFVYANSGAAGTLIRATDITETRAALDAVLPTVGFATTAYTDTSLAGVPIKAVHFEELRDRMQ